MPALCSVISFRLDSTILQSSNSSASLSQSFHSCKNGWAQEAVKEQFQGQQVPSEKNKPYSKCLQSRGLFVSIVFKELSPSSVKVSTPAALAPVHTIFVPKGQPTHLTCLLQHVATSKTFLEPLLSYEAPFPSLPSPVKLCDSVHHTWLKIL